MIAAPADPAEAALLERAFEASLTPHGSASRAQHDLAKLGLPADGSPERVRGRLLQLIDMLRAAGHGALALRYALAHAAEAEHPPAALLGEMLATASSESVGEALTFLQVSGVPRGQVVRGPFLVGGLLFILLMAAVHAERQPGQEARARLAWDAARVAVHGGERGGTLHPCTAPTEPMCLDHRDEILSTARLLTRYCRSAACPLTLVGLSKGIEKWASTD